MFTAAPSQMVALVSVTLGDGEASARSHAGLLFVFCSTSVWAKETGGSRPGRSSSHIQFKPPAGGGGVGVGVGSLRKVMSFCRRIQRGVCALERGGGLT